MKTIVNSRLIKNSLYTAIFTSAIILTSCEGEEGPMGPSGPQGPSGQQGAQGADGIANVYAATYDVAPGDWTGNADGFKTTLNFPEITEAIFSNGAVLIYELMDENTADKSFHLLPYTEVIGTSITYLDFDAYIGKITIKMRWTDNGVNSTESPKSNYAFKIVIIQGTALGSLKDKVNIADMNAVIKFANNEKLNYQVY